MGVFSGGLTVALVVGLTGICFAQQGNQGTIGRSNGSVEGIEQGISRYLNGEELDSVVTPGESIDYTLELKVGQVVVSEARSDAFDPALEIVNSKGKVMASNDDRYPGDQRPLLLWRCDADGTYKARVRSFRDKAGGQVFVRMKTYQTVDLTKDGLVEKEIDATEPFLVRVPMKAGQVKEEVSDLDAGRGYLAYNFNALIAPNGLPDIGLSFRLQPAIYGLLVPVDGDYYIMHTPVARRGETLSRGKVHIGTREIIPAKLVREGDGFVTKSATNVPMLAELPVKKGDLIQVATPDLNLQTQLFVLEQPDLSKYDMAKPETNPFFPHPGRVEYPNGPAFDLLPARARDGRVISFRARRDAKLWVATNAVGPSDKTFSLQVKPAAREFEQDKANVGLLKVAYYDQWVFDAKPGDVMTLDSSAPSFNQVIVVRDPDLEEIRHVVAGVDQKSDGWRMIVQKPGRYLVQVSCLGDGGSGEYSLTRKAFQPKEFAKGNAAKGEISAGQVQVWKFTVSPNDPLFMRWNSTNWDYDIAIYDEQGRPTNFQRDSLDAQNRVGLLIAAKPTTFVIVLTGTGAKANYSISLGGLPSDSKG